MYIKPPVRQIDGYGDGRFGAPRDGGTRMHGGVDYACYPGTEVCPRCPGTVTKLGWAYKGDPHYRYVQVTDTTGLRHRYFYVEPLVSKGDFVVVNDVIGTVQDLWKRYPPELVAGKLRIMTNHYHYEIRDKTNAYVNPETL